MEENTENTEVQGQRVTRARTRRMSLLDTDSRPGTPQLDTAADRGTASPRPTRRTRLNSVTLDVVRTPTRPTRASLARGETPEPTTPSSVKRTARTPAKTKAMPKQLTLKEEEAEELEAKQPEKPSSRTNTPTPTGEKRVTRSMSQTPPSVTRPSSQPDLIAFPEDKAKRELESGDKPAQGLEKEVKAPESVRAQTPKVSVRLEKLKVSEQGRGDLVSAEEIKNQKSTASPLNKKGRTDTVSAEEIKQKGSASPRNEQGRGDIKQKASASPINLLVVEGPNKDDHKPTLDSEKSQTLPISINKERQAEPKAVTDLCEPAENTGEMQPATVRPPEQNDSLEEQEFLDAQESLPVEEPQRDERESEMEQVVDESLRDGRESEMEQDSKVEQQVMPKTDIAEPEVDIKEAAIEAPKEELVAKPEEEIKPPESPMDVDEEIQAAENSVVILSPVPLAGDIKKAVGFSSDTEEVDMEKKRFPKTPGREKVPSSINFTPKPLKPDGGEQRRNSSTPLLKSQESQLVQPPPLQIDAIKPLDDLEKEGEFSLVQPANMSPKKAVSAILALLNSDDEAEEMGAEEEDQCEFVDNEAEEAPAHYQSGDSMDSSTRREVEENEIHCDGESVGSQDTEDESPGDSYESNDSFIVPDDNVEEEDDLDPLCYSTDEDDEVEHFVAQDKKQRRRILVAESSEDESQAKEQNKSKLAKSKEQSNCSSDASKLSEAAQMMNGSAEKTPSSETELESSRLEALKELNKSERFNKTATRLDASVLELDSTDQEEEEEQEHPEKGNRSVFEIMDSEDDGGVVEEDEEEEPEAAAEPAAEEAEEEEEETALQTQKSSKSADEEALLAELASSDLRHLETMFNPLQKSRRQSLLMSRHELAAKEPKLKRRSDRALVGSDFCPSQSFVEMIAEQKRSKNKRKRLSKSFSGAAEDLEEMGGMHQERKRLKSSKGDSTESLEEDEDPSAEAPPEEHSAELETSGQELEFMDEPMEHETSPDTTPEKVAKNVSLKMSPAKETSLDTSQSKAKDKPTREENVAKNASPAKETPLNTSQSKAKDKPIREPVEDKPIPSLKASASKGKPEPKTAEYYLEYCNNILQKANEAFRKKKKEDIVAGKKQKKQKRPAASEAGTSDKAMPVLTLETRKPTSKTALVISKAQAGKPASMAPPPPKKDLKRLQAARQAVGHAVNLLAPPKAVGKEPRSLARKLSPQPPMEAKKKEGKKVKKNQKQKVAETSPLKSSDEENHVVQGNRFRTNAGIVTVSMIDSPPRGPIIELIKTSSGIMRVEPATPKQKYFREVPTTPRNQFLEERPASSEYSKKRTKPKAAAGGNPNSAMQSALRFKEQAFARKF